MRPDVTIIDMETEHSMNNQNKKLAEALTKCEHKIRIFKLYLVEVFSNTKNWQ